MAKRVTDQEKELWICDIRDCCTIDEIVVASGRSKSTIYKYTLNQATPRKQKSSQIKSINEWENCYQDGEDWSDDPYEDMSTYERAAYEFIESGGCNGAILWNSEARRSLALNMMQYPNDMIGLSVGHCTQEDIEKCSRWLAPITADWVMTEGGETYDMARIYGLTAIIISQPLMYSFIPIDSVNRILENMNEGQNELLRIQLFLASYRYLGITIAKHLKNNTNTSKFNVQDFSENKQAFLLGYSYTICGAYLEPTRSDICEKVLEVISPFQKKDTEHRKKLFNYVEKGYKTAYRDITTNKAKLINPKFMSSDNIQKYLYFLIYHNYIVVHS